MSKNRTRKTSAPFRWRVLHKGTTVLLGGAAAAVGIHLGVTGPLLSPVEPPMPGTTSAAALSNPAASEAVEAAPAAPDTVEAAPAAPDTMDAPAEGADGGRGVHMAARRDQDTAAGRDGGRR